MWSEILDRNLEWVTEVGVRIDSTGDHTVSTTELASNIEQRLRQSGITVTSPPLPGPSGTPHTLQFIIVVAPGVNQSFIRMRLRVAAWLRATGDSSGQLFEGPMWMTDMRSQVVNNADIERCLREDIALLVDEFVAAYESAHQHLTCSVSDEIDES
jgi:hypothetical protein